MKTVTALEIETAIWRRIEGDISPSAARALLKIQFPECDHERMRQLSEKAAADKLNAAEEKEIDAYERLGCMLDVLHSKARQALKKRKSAS